MGFKCGIIGLPNVGKSTLFNALMQSSAAEAANYPFCTIEPNIGRVSVPDDRLHKLVDLAHSQQVIPNQIEFRDIAGLVQGASKGEGLGNQFLAHIREVDAIIHVLRCFEDGDVTRVGTDPVQDAEIIETELILADLQSLLSRLPSLEKKAKKEKKDNQHDLLEVVKKVISVLEKNKPASAALQDASPEHLHALQLLTTKPMLHVCNVGEGEVLSGNEMTRAVADFAGNALIISAKIESEIALLQDEREKKEFLESVGLGQTGLDSIIRASYKLLNLETFFTVGPKEARAWTVKKSASAPEAAGVIHSDFQRGFIKAEVISYDDYIKYGGEQGCRAAGKLRLEGRDYQLQDGDVVHFRFNVY
ncbi:ribosome-binding ATPase YchF [Rickettsiales bacterium]|nr:ribosome-binding ATPase YchF [Rickettsiales bacterium]